MTLLVIISFFVGAALAEVALRVNGRLRSSHRLPEIMALMQAFRQAIHDDARQELLMRTGLATLKLSLAGLGLLLGVALLAWLPPWSLGWTDPEQVVYLVVSSVMAMLWWFIRRTEYAADRAE